MWHLASAWSTPARPEIHQYIVAFAYPVAQFGGIAVEVVHLKVGELDARLTLCHCLHLLLHSVAQGMVYPYGTGVDIFNKFFVVEHIVHLRHQQRRSDIVLVVGDICYLDAVASLLNGVDLDGNLVGLCFVLTGTGCLPILDERCCENGDVALEVHLVQLVVELRTLYPVVVNEAYLDRLAVVENRDETWTATVHHVSDVEERVLRSVAFHAKLAVCHLTSNDWFLGAVGIDHHRFYGVGQGAFDGEVAFFLLCTG